MSTKDVGVLSLFASSWGNLLLLQTLFQHLYAMPFLSPEYQTVLMRDIKYCRTTDWMYFHYFSLFLMLRKASSQAEKQKGSWCFHAVLKNVYHLFLSNQKAYIFVYNYRLVWILNKNRQESSPKNPFHVIYIFLWFCFKWRFYH